jgi:eukaryotic-like serine/threonine-protein kinase
MKDKVVRRSLWLLTFIFASQFSLAKVTIQHKDWPRHRGDASLRGISTQKIGTKLKLDWVFETGDFLKSSVVVSGDLAYVGADTGVVHAIDVETGKEKWKFKTKLSIEAPPMVHDGIVYIGSTDGFLYALDAQSGKLKWKYETQGEIMGAANQANRPESNDSVIVVGSYDNFVHCVDAQRGKLVWKFETQNYINGVPTIYEGKYVVFGGCDAVLYVVSLENGKLVRSVEVEAPIAASVAVSDGVGYVGNMERAVMAFDLDSGEVAWNYRSKSFPYFSSPALTEKHVLIGGRDKGLHCIKRVSGKIEWRFAARGRIDSSPVVSIDKVIFGSMDGKLYILALHNGKEITSYEIGEPISSTVALTKGRILVSCEDGNVYSFTTITKE